VRAALLGLCLLAAPVRGAAGEKPSSVAELKESIHRELLAVRRARRALARAERGGDAGEKARAEAALAQAKARVKEERALLRRALAGS
jgi:hypothetical protein